MASTQTIPADKTAPMITLTTVEQGNEELQQRKLYTQAPKRKDFDLDEHGKLPPAKRIATRNARLDTMLKQQRLEHGEEMRETNSQTEQGHDGLHQREEVFDFEAYRKLPLAERIAIRNENIKRNLEQQRLQHERDMKKKDAQHYTAVDEGGEEERKTARAPATSKRVLRGSSKPGKEPVDKGAGGTKKSAASKSTATSTGKSSSRAAAGKAKKATAKASDKVKGKGKGRKDDEQPKNRSKAGLEKPTVSQRYDIRRILAQRDVGKETFYNVDWYPSWVKERAVRQPVIDDWEANEAKYTFRWGEDVVYKVDNPTNDISAQYVRQLIESVLLKYREYMNKPPDETAAELFEHDDWEFFRTKDRNGAIQAAAAADDDHPNITAAEVMQHTFIEGWNDKNNTPEGSRARRYGKIRVQFTGEIDERATSHRFQPDQGMTPLEFTEAIFANALWDDEYMDLANWNAQGADKKQVGTHLDVLQPLVAELVTTCPYLLKHAWPLLFISLFYWDSEVKDLLADSDFEFDLVGAKRARSRWARRVQDCLIYTYLDECEWEMRCMDEVNETFVQAQQFIEDSLAHARGAGEGDDDGNDDDDDDDENEEEKIPSGTRGGTHGSKAKGKAKAKESDNEAGPSGTQKKK